MLSVKHWGILLLYHTVLLNIHQYSVLNELSNRGLFTSLSLIKKLFPTQK